MTLKTDAESRTLLTDVRELILTARQNVARSANAGLAALYWRVGDRIRLGILQEKRAEYGEQIVATLSQQLGWSHFVELLLLKKHLQREFYAEMCRVVQARLGPAVQWDSKDGPGLLRPRKVAKGKP